LSARRASLESPVRRRSTERPRLAISPSSVSLVPVRDYELRLLVWLVPSTIEQSAHVLRVVMRKRSGDRLLVELTLPALAVCVGELEQDGKRRPEIGRVRPDDL
jgi:hypothetical protein